MALGRMQWPGCSGFGTKQVGADVVVRVGLGDGVVCDGVGVGVRSVGVSVGVRGVEVGSVEVDGAGAPAVGVDAPDAPPLPPAPEGEAGDVARPAATLLSAPLPEPGTASPAVPDVGPETPLTGADVLAEPAATSDGPWPALPSRPTESSEALTRPG